MSPTVIKMTFSRRTLVQGKGARLSAYAGADPRGGAAGAAWGAGGGDGLPDRRAARAGAGSANGREVVRSLGEAQRNPGHSSLASRCGSDTQKARARGWTRDARHATPGQRAQPGLRCAPPRLRLVKAAGGHCLAGACHVKNGVRTTHVHPCGRLLAARLATSG